jgi:hypothetical protein
MPKIRQISICVAMACLCCAPLRSPAQNAGKRLNYAFQDSKGNPLAMPLTGGLGNPQFSEADLDNDGRKDLLVFDRIGDVPLAFRNGGTPNQVDYHFAPELAEHFPRLYGWALMRDYNGDGVPDIFSFAETLGVGIEVYTGHYNNQNKLEFIKYKNPLYNSDVLSYPGGGGQLNIYVSKIDIPSIDDIDGDGDLDIATFEINGGVVEMYKNNSVESGWQRDSLRYVRADKCWGRFYENGFSNSIDLSSSIDTCAVLNIPAGRGNSAPRHAGSSSLTLDIDGDGDKDILLGDISFPNLTLLINSGGSKAYMTSQDPNFPSYDVPVDMEVFPAPFLLDVDNDGKKDLVAAYNSNSLEDIDVAWLYKNVSSNNHLLYEYQGNGFLGEQSIDQGTYSIPAVVDYNADGLMDLVVGATHFTTFSNSSSLQLYENIGSTGQPIFKLVDSDYLGFSQYNTTNAFNPAFGDLDGDGDLDLLVGESFGSLFYLENTAGAGSPLAFAKTTANYQAIDVGSSSTPCIFDADKDGLADIIVGERNGNLNFFKNIGTMGAPAFNSNPDQTPNNSFWGKVDARQEGYATGFSRPSILQDDTGKEYLFVGSESGNILRYEDLSSETFTKASASYGNTREGDKTSAAFYDFDSNGYYDMLLGNYRGGLGIFETDIPSGLVPTVQIQGETLEMLLSPNPASGQLRVSLEGGNVPDRIQYRILDVLGRECLRQNGQGTAVFDVSPLPSGLYFCQVRLGTASTTAKFLKR